MMSAPILSLLPNTRKYESIFGISNLERIALFKGYNLCPKGCFPHRCTSCDWLNIGEDVKYISYASGKELISEIRDVFNGVDRFEGGVYIKLVAAARPAYRVRKILDQNDIEYHKFC